MGFLVHFFPKQFTGLKCGFRLRVGNPVARFRVREGGEILEFVSAALGHSSTQARMMIRKEKKRCAGGPLLTHEQERRSRRTKQQSRGRSIGRKVDLVMQTLA